MLTIQVTCRDEDTEEVERQATRAAELLSLDLDGVPGVTVHVLDEMGTVERWESA
jgi:hypothetical protein